MMNGGLGDALFLPLKMEGDGWKEGGREAGKKVRREEQARGCSSHQKLEKA